MFKFCTLLMLLLPMAKSAFSQKIDSLLTIQRKADPQEKIYVHFDKRYYNPGETIWYKAYLFTGIEPSEASKNFYAELLDAQGNVISHKTAPIAFSGASGSFDLDSNFNKPVVYFRGYTITSLNGDTSFLYTKAVQVIPAKPATTKTAAVQPPPSISFLPEGGDLVNGLTSTVAFIASSSTGMPVTVKGTIVNSSGTKVAELQSLHNGMGSFLLTPQQGETYTATWKTESGKTYTTPLPAAKPQGVILRLAMGEGSRRFALHRTGDVQDPLKKLHLIGYMNQHLVFQATADLVTKNGASGQFPTKNLPSGILQLTVFDSDYRPVAERIVFVNNHDFELDGDAYIAQKNFSKRGLNYVEITVSDTLPTNLSVSITDADLNDGNKLEDNIISRLLLTGDLRGRVYNPYYYFFSNDDSTALHLDLVMLTHGWRRYNWDHVFAGRTTPQRFKESNYLSLSGKIAGLSPGSYSPDLQLTGILQTSDSVKTFVSLPVDRKGAVFTEGLVFYDNAKLFFNFNKKSLTFDKSMLMLDNGLRKRTKHAVLDSAGKLHLSEVSPSVLANNQKINKLALQASRQLLKVKTLESITVTAKVKTPKEKMEEKYVRGLFTGDANSFDLVNDPLSRSFMNIFQYLQGKVAGLQINTSGGTPTLNWRGGTPVLYLNEMQADASMISSTPVSDIAYVKVFRPGASMVSGGGGGVIAIYTRRGGDEENTSATKGLNAVQIAGYSAVKQFYSPNYAIPSERDGLDDVRTTLYWNPSIYLDKTRRRLRFQFYNNDVTKRFRLVLEGFNAEGKLIHVEKEIGNQ